MLNPTTSPARPKTPSPTTLSALATAALLLVELGAAEVLVPDADADAESDWFEDAVASLRLIQSA